MNTAHPFNSTDPSDDTILLTAPLAQALLMQIATTETNLRLAREELRGLHETMANAKITPADKVLAVLALEHVGAAPRRPSPYRLTEFVNVSLGELADKIGLSQKQVGARLRGLCDASLIRVEHYTKPDSSGMPRRFIRIAPPDGAAWESTWAKPARIGPVISSRLVKDAERKARQREKERENLQKARAILAQCPECNSLLLDVRCHVCGTITAIEDMHSAPSNNTSSRKRDSTLRVGNE